MSTLASVIQIGLLSARPAAGIPGRLYFATDTGQTFRDNGSTWDTVGTSGAVNSLTTTGSSGAATLTAGVLNIPVYTGGGGGFTPIGEVPTGTINGTNVTFTLSFAPNPSSFLMLTQNGIVLKQGADYTLSTLTITFATAPSTGDSLNAFYTH